MPRHWQVLLMAALGIGATVIAVPRALSGIVGVPEGVQSGISRTAPETPSSKPSTAKIPVWSANPSAASTTPDTRPPSAVTGLRVLANNESAISISWDAGADNVAVKLYVVRGDGFATIETSDTKVTVSWPHRTSSVSVQVSAIDTSGNQGEWRSLTVTPPSTAGAGPTTSAPTSPPASTTAPVVTSSPPSIPPSSDTSTTPVVPPDTASAGQSTAAQDPSSAGVMANPSSTQGA